MSTLKINLTYHCTAECGHCRFHCERKPGPVISYDTAMQTIQYLYQHNHLECVVILGGEPGLYPDLTRRLLIDAARLGLKTRLETNGFWAKDAQRAEAFLAPLKPAGTMVSFSADAYHREYIPLGTLETAMRAAEKLGLFYGLEVPFIDKENPGLEPDRQTRSVLAELEQRLGRTPCCANVYEGPIAFTGRAARNLAAMVAPGRGIPAEPCTAVPWWFNSEIDSLELLILEPEGYLSKGCGIIIGNVETEPISQVLRQFDAKTHPVFGTLLRQGPLGLAREAAQYGYQLKADYADKCHLCDEARQFLHAKYPEYLLPV